jgi:hypothetical protein
VAASHLNGWPRVLAKKERGREIWSRETEGEIQATGGGVPTERERETEGEIQATGLEFQRREREGEI